MDYGRTVIGNTGIPVYCEATGQGIYAPVGITLDWSTVAAVGADTVVQPEGLTVKAGQKYLRHGQFLCKVTNQPVQTLTLGGTITGGTFSLSGYRLDTGGYVTTGPLAYNITPAALQAALQGLDVFNTTPFAVTGTAGASYVITSPVALLTVDGSLLTGTTPTATIALTTAVGNYGTYGPFDPAAADGRQTLTRGNCALLNNTVLQNGVLGAVTFLPSNHPGVLVGGAVFKARVIATAGTHSLAAGPTYAEVEAAMPRLEWVSNP